MKARSGFVSNSSSTSFIITNKTDRDMSLRDFCTATLDTVLTFYNEDEPKQKTRKEVLDSVDVFAKRISEERQPHGEDGIHFSQSIEVPAHSSRTFMFSGYGLREPLTTIRYLPPGTSKVWALN